MSRVIISLVALVLTSQLVAAQAPPPPADAPLFRSTVTISPGGNIESQTQIIGTVQGISTQTPVRDQQPARTGTSRIRGHVVAADTGAPLRRAAVRINSPEIREGRSTMTDNEGRFEFADLPAGRYAVSAIKNGYVTMNYGQTQPTDPQKQLDVPEKQLVDRIDFKLPRGGVIIGRILDEYGEPVAGAQVQPMQNRFMGAGRRPMPAGPGSSTPDTGEFRLWGLTPGDYYISVTLRGGPIMMNDTSDDRSGYATTFYPGTPNIAEAQPIAVAAGQIASGVDIILSQTRTAKVTGTAVDSSGQLVRGGMVMAMSRSAGIMMSSVGGQIKPDGTFTVTGLAPGDYVLRGQPIPPRSGNDQETLIALINVNGADLTGVVLASVSPIVVRGRVILDPAGASLDPATLQVSVNPKNPEMMIPIGNANMGPVPVKNDFTFEVKSNPGQTMIRAFVGGPGVAPVAAAAQNTWVIKSVQYDSKDITDSGIELTSGHDVNDVEIVLTNRLQIVTGAITNTRGEIVKDGVVLVFSQNKERWAEGFGRHVSQGRPDREGKYTLRTLPPGEYFAVALEQIDNRRFPGDPDYLESLARDAARFTLVEGETRTVDLKLTVQQ